jgi:hypothetical protein
MKRLLSLGLMCLSLTRLALAQDPIYINNGIVNTPTNIDALAFVNNGVFFQPILLALTNQVAPLFTIVAANPSVTTYDFSDVDNYTNRGPMGADTGFFFDNAPSSFGVRHASASFNNLNPGLVAAGSFSNLFSSTFVIFTGFSPKLKVNATNIVNTGLLDIGSGGVMRLTGKNIDLRNGRLHHEGFNDTTSLIFGGTSVGGLLSGFTDLGIFVNYFAADRQTNVITLGNFSIPAISPAANETNQAGTLGLQQLIFPAPSTFANVQVLNTNNFTFQIVFVEDTLAQVSTDVRFEPFNDFALPIIRYSSTVSNFFTGGLLTNEVFVADAFANATNLNLVTNVVTQNPSPAPIPANYSFYRSFPGYTNLPVGNTPYSLNLFVTGFGTNGSVTNNYTSLGVGVQQVTFQVDPAFPTQNITNIGGRIEIIADDVLNLNNTIMDGPNYVLLQATNHFAGSTNAHMQFPFADINLRSTNGLLNFTNVLAPNIPRLNGPIELYSARWTNLSTGMVIATNGMTNTFAITNRFHVLMALSAISPTAPAIVKDLILRSTGGSSNMVISDIVNVSNSLIIDAKSLTITSNAPGSPAPTGQLNLLSQGIIWSSSLSTNLSFVTNFGTISAQNTIFFQKRINPSFPSTNDGPYSNFVNHGTVSMAGGIFWDNNFENTGTGPGPASVFSSSGPVTVQAVTALMTNGNFSAPAGDMTISSGTLTISNHALSASGFLSIGGSNSVNDGISGPITNALTGANSWTAGDGFNLVSRPTANSSLFGTTISSTAASHVTTENLCSGGFFPNLTTNGFNNVLPPMSNNVPIGHLILRGIDSTSAFHFKGPDSVNPYAIYVDKLELVDAATNRVAPNFPAFHIDTNVTIYFLSAVIGSTDISEKLNGANTNRLRWLSNYVGRFSFVNITYPDAQTFQFNRALAQSFTIDSDNDGTVNGIDPTPFPEPFTGSSIGLNITVTNTPAATAKITWQSPAGATNYLYMQNMGSTNWTVLTNFVQGSVAGPNTINDPLHSGRLYRVRIDPLHN